jgi:alpha-L-fucosidase
VFGAKKGIAMNRRTFLKTSSAAALSTSVLGCSSKNSPVPSYLHDYADLYKNYPKQAALEWFRNAKFGLFMHYGLYSLLGRGEWVMLNERIPVSEYEKLKNEFKADKFNIDYITDMALEAGMNYINITAKHHDGFCLFETKVDDYNSASSPAQRDLIGDLSQACKQKGLGLFLYYSYFADWRHPYFYAREAGWKNARPAYNFDEPRYKWQTSEDFRIYVNDVHIHLKELLTNYGPIAGIWFDPIMGYYSRPDLFPIDETYSLVRSLQPHTLISAKQGANGEEDFAAPERSGHSLADRFDDPVLKRAPQQAWERNKRKHNEICDTLQPRVWGYKKADDSKHKNADEVMQMLTDAEAANCNLLLNTGPLPDGSIDATDAATLREVGQRLRQG